MDDSGYEQLVSNIRNDAANKEARGDIPPEDIDALRTFAEYIATGRWGTNPYYT